MNKDHFKKIEVYMLECMKDCAHDKDHIYRVLYLALDIANLPAMYQTAFCPIVTEAGIFQRV